MLVGVDRSFRTERCRNAIERIFLALQNGNEIAVQWQFECVFEMLEEATVMRLEACPGMTIVAGQTLRLALLHHCINAQRISLLTRR